MTTLNFQKEIGTTETMRTACAAWSNTVKYRPKNPPYFIFRYSKGERRYISWRHVSLRARPERWVWPRNVGSYIHVIFLDNLSCPVSQQQPYGNARTFLTLFLHCAFGILLHKIAKFVVTSDPLDNGAFDTLNYRES